MSAYRVPSSLSIFPHDAVKWKVSPVQMPSRLQNYYKESILALKIPISKHHSAQFTEAKPDPSVSDYE